MVQASSMNGLDGLSALVTGASAGIGRATAEALASAGARVFSVARRANALDQLTRGLPGGAQRGHDYMTADLARESAVDSVLERVSDWGRVDILVNNAGVSVPAPNGAAPEVWQEAFTVQFHAPRRLTEGLLPAMLDNRFGRIINLGGTLEPGDVPNASTAAKAALTIWAKAVANAAAASGVTVNTVIPGRVESAQLTALLHPDPAERVAFARDRIPARRFGRAAEVAQLIRFLASSSADYITGTAIPVDGAFHRYAF
jgi:3-oxoacyl-[acyl-carrier protein] reductase